MGHEFELLSNRVIEAAIAVHKSLRPGILESIYQKAMEVALRHRNLTFELTRRLTPELQFANADHQTRRALTSSFFRTFVFRVFVILCCGLMAEV